EGLPQFGQRITADHCRQQEAVRFQRAADLRQHPRQVIDELKCQSGDHKVERLRLERQDFLRIRIDMLQTAETLAQRPAQQFTRRPDIGHVGKTPQYRAQALVNVVGHAIEQEGLRPELPRTALPPLQQRAIEQDGSGIRTGCHTRWYAALPRSGNPRWYGGSEVRFGWSPPRTATSDLDTSLSACPADAR